MGQDRIWKMDTEGGTADYLTTEGEGRKAMGQLLTDKTISWPERRRLLQTNAGAFPCEARLQKWGKHPDGICGLCKRSREMGLKLLRGSPARGTTGHLQSSVCRLQAPAATGAHNFCFQQVQDDMSKALSVSKEKEFVSKGTEISLGILWQYTSRHSRLISTQEWSRLRTQRRFGRLRRRRR